MAVKYFQTFRPSSEYEAAAADAQRRQALADALQQQAYQPLQMDMAGPVSYTQGLAKILQSYMAGKESRKAREAEQKASAAIEKDVAGVERTGQQLRESLESGRKPLTAAETTPDESGLAMVRGPLDPVRLASTKYGREALVTDPELLEAYKAARTKPKMPALTAEQLMTLDPASRKMAQAAIEGGQNLDYGALKLQAKPKDVTHTVDLGNKIEVHYNDGTSEIKTKGVAPSAEPKQLYSVKVNGVDTYVPYSQAIGKASAKESGAKPSEAENQASYLTNRVLNAQRQINQVTAQAPGALRPGAMEAAVSSIPIVRQATGAVQSPERQIVSAAQSDMLDALLTLATGISYTEEQKEANKKSYLPSITENDQVAAAKYDRLLGVVAGAKARAGRAWTPEMDKALQDVLVNPFTKQEQAAPQGGLSPAEQAELAALRAKRGGRN
jgi:hypothetical protein